MLSSTPMSDHPDTDKFKSAMNRVAVLLFLLGMLGCEIAFDTLTPKDRFQGEPWTLPRSPEIPHNIEPEEKRWPQIRGSVQWWPRKVVDYTVTPASLEWPSPALRLPDPENE